MNVLDYEPDQFTAEVDKNVFPVFTLLKFAGRKMTGGGSFVAVSSTAAVFSTRGLASYRAGKAAVDALVDVAADELGEEGIRVNSVRPGPHPHRQHHGHLRERRPLRPVPRAAGHRPGRRGGRHRRRHPVPRRPGVVVDHRPAPHRRRRPHAPGVPGHASARPGLSTAPRSIRDRRDRTRRPARRLGAGPPGPGRASGHRPGDGGRGAAGQAGGQGQARRPGRAWSTCAIPVRSGSSAPSWATCPPTASSPGAGLVDGRPVMVGAEDFTTLAGSIGPGSTSKRYRIAELALAERIPLIMLLEGAGHRGGGWRRSGARPTCWRRRSARGGCRCSAR